MRAAHNRSLSGENAHLWEYVSSQSVQEEQEVELPQTKKREARLGAPSSTILSSQVTFS